MWPEESVTIEMDHVGRVVCDPSLGLPGKVDEEFSHDCESREAGDVDELRGAGCENGRELAVTDVVDRSVCGRGLHEKEPVLIGFVHDQVRELSVQVELDFQREASRCCSKSMSFASASPT